MINTLLLTKDYCDKALANGICVQSIENELKNNGISVRVLSVESPETMIQNDNTNVVIYENKINNIPIGILGKCFRYMVNRIVYSNSPKYDKKMISAIYERGCELCNKHHIDTIIAFYFPLETVIAAIQLKRTYPHLKVIIYELDSVEDGVTVTKRRLRYVAKSYSNFLKKVYAECDNVVIQCSHKKYWEKEYHNYIDKMKCVDLPLLRPWNQAFSTNNYGETIFIYAGSLNLEYRSPEPLLKLMDAYPDSCFVLDFYTNSCKTLIEAFGNSHFVFNGYIDNKVLDSKIADSDILVNIGNKFSNSVPSKLINYISTGKPIIHVAYSLEDICIDYLKRYPLSYIIFINDIENDAEQTSAKLKQFVDSCKGKRVSFDEIINLYPMNLPAYSINALLSKSKECNISKE